MNGLPVLILPSIEKRFSLTSTEIGVLSTANDIAAAFFVIFIGFYGDYGNKIKWVAGGAAVAGFVFFFVLPFLLNPHRGVKILAKSLKKMLAIFLLLL